VSRTLADALPVHPFPARMAPELALRHAKALPPQSTVLDPMVGSGTTLRFAADHGHQGIGFDVDPLAVLMTRVWTTPLDVTKLRRRGVDALAAAINDEARVLRARPHSADTDDFMAYWFAPQQRRDLELLASVLRRMRGPVGDALRLALSRIIITKDRGASLARDVSHSRPHKVAEDSDYDVGRGFLRSVEQLAGRLERNPPPGGVDVKIGDARDIPVDDESIDAVITSPPYLNAIDYLRGHRLALVWLGFELNHLREVRGTSIGTERGIGDAADHALAERLATRMGDLEQLPAKQVRMVLRYVLDMLAVMKETARVLRDDGRATLVVGNSSIRGVFLANDAAITACARQAGLRRTSRRERPLPPSRRYLPPPARTSGRQLEQRMRTEVILRFRLA
jgi:SAM-dependent methyltransferase